MYVNMLIHLSLIQGLVSALEVNAASDHEKPHQQSGKAATSPRL